MNAPFLDFYKQNSISPVRQDISDLGRHISRRDHLYRRLGLPPFAFTGKRIIEFGCGSGHNALYLESRNPAELILVDANDTGIKEALNVVSSGVIASNILDYKDESTYDIVICEGVIPHQKHPDKFAQHVGSFVAPGGVLVITVADYIGVLSEVMRRLVRDRLMNSKAPVQAQLSVLRPMFASHANSLPGMSRPLDDWLTDTIIQPWPYPLFPMNEAILALDDDFETLGTSPDFLDDWRWYKDVYGHRAHANDRAIWQYNEARSGFLDASAPSRPDAKMPEVATIAKRIFDYMREIEEADKRPDWKRVALECSSLAQIAPHTRDALYEVAAFFELQEQAGYFAKWFGHGQQYISFVRK